MIQVKYLILGAGPSSLAFAHCLLDQGESSFVILEKEADPGGLCRSMEVDGAPLDIGGGHFLDVRNKVACDFLFRFMPENEWVLHTRIAKIKLRGIEVDHPLEANLWQLPIEAQSEFLESIAQAGCVIKAPIPEMFEDWCRWKFGERLANEYMLPYNRKIWRMPLNRLGTYWLNKLPNVSFRETLMSCLQRKMHGVLPAHGEFLYPKNYGYGEVWKRMGAALGDRLVLNSPLTDLDLEKRIVNGCYRSKIIVSSIPWQFVCKATSVPEYVGDAVSNLVHIPIDVDYHPKNADSLAHWIYEPDEQISYHRILARSNFANNSRGCWTETNARVAQSTKAFRYHNEFAYPVNTIDKPTYVQMIHDWANSAGILPIGRWGNWEHMNSDVAVSQGINAALEILARN